MTTTLTNAELEEARAKVLAQDQKRTDQEADRLLDRVAAALREIHPRDQVYPHHDRGKAIVSSWFPGLGFGHARIILQVGREHLMEVYATRSRAQDAVDTLDALTKRGFTLSRNIVAALDRWAPGRTLASRRYDDMETTS